jgi:divalent metal cation (Fe/Co/Zn/Cd) transporter
VQGGANILDQEAAAIESALRRRWDIPGSALLGAGLGTLVQGSHEFQQNVVTPSGVSEPMTSSLLALALAALAGTILFTVVTIAHNVTTKRLSRKTRAPGLVYHWNDFTFAGAILGILLVLAHEAFNFLSGRWQTDFLGSTDPFTHIVWELIIVALGGELWFRAVVKIRSWDAA